MISGAHAVIYSTNPESDRAFFRDVLGFPSVDAGHGWLIFALPAAEVAFHPSHKNNVHELYFTCENLKATITQLQSKNIETSEIHEERWGILTKIKLPGGGEIGLYQPKHPLAR